MPISPLGKRSAADRSPFASSPARRQRPRFPEPTCSASSPVVKLDENYLARFPNSPFKAEPPAKTLPTPAVATTPWPSTPPAKPIGSFSAALTVVVPSPLTPKPDDTRDISTAEKALASASKARAARDRLAAARATIATSTSS